MKQIHALITLILIGVLSSCTSGTLMVRGVNYQSVRTEFAQPSSIPNDAKIAIEYFFNESGYMQAVVYNLTTEIMIIDQTKSFVIMPNGTSISYYDPTVYTSTQSSFGSKTESTSFNLGGVAQLLGVGGPLGGLLGSTTLGSATTTGQMNQNTVIKADLPNVSIGPKGRMAMSKTFPIPGIGKESLYNKSIVDCKMDASPVKFSVCVSYSTDGGETYEKIITKMYLSSYIYEPVQNKKVNNAFYTIYQKKPDALAENVYLFHIPNNIMRETTDALGGFISHSHIYDSYIQGSLVDFQ